MTDRDELIRARAYAIWEAEGCPQGRDEQHWQQAALDVDETAQAGRMEPAEMPAQAGTSQPPVADTSAQAAAPAARGDTATPAPATARKPRSKAQSTETALAKPRSRKTKGA